MTRRPARRHRVPPLGAAPLPIYTDGGGLAGASIARDEVRCYLGNDRPETCSAFDLAGRATRPLAPEISLANSDPAAVAVVDARPAHTSSSSSSSVHPNSCACVPAIEARLRTTAIWLGLVSPLPGDIAIYYSNRREPDHIGIVEKHRLSVQD